jgi:hypothetical protein
MARLPDPLRRHGVALALTAAAVWVFIGATLPALEERTLQRRQAEAAELQRSDRADQVRRHELLLQASLDDPMVQERLSDGLRLSPALAGPQVVTPGETAADELGRTPER